MTALTTSSRDDFPEPIKRALAARVNHRCSNPDCGAPTGGPQIEPGKALNVGVAAHIAGAAPGGPRYEPTMTAQQRADIANGVWLCQTCAKLIDNDPVRFHAALLQEWKAVAERAALDQVGKASPRQGAVQIVDKWVSLSYPEEAGVIREQAAAGYDLYWSRANDEAQRVDLQGWEPVLVEQPDGTRARLKVRDHPSGGGYVILLRKRSS